MDKNFKFDKNVLWLLIITASREHIHDFTFDDVKVTEFTGFLNIFQKQ